MKVRRRYFLYGTAGTLLAVVTRTFFRLRAQPNVLISGQVNTWGGSPIQNARITLFTTDLTFFREARSDAAGNYIFSDVPTGTYQLGACALEREYQEVALVVNEPGTTQDFDLDLETHPGSWAVIGSTEPETFGGSNSGSLLADGRVFFCHDATDPILFDPTNGQTNLAAESASEQGCHMPTYLLDGRLLIIGGGTLDDQGNFSDGQEAVATVKAYDPATDSWENWPDLTERRWYPGLARLSDGRLLLFGGGQQPTLGRTDICEILDPTTRQSTPTGSLLKAGGFGPAVLLYTGKVLLTWEPPQLYDPATGTWELAAPFLQPNRATLEGCPLPHNPPPGQIPPAGDHPDHTAIFLPDGRVAAIGIRRTALSNPGSMVEIYDPESNSWSLGSSPETIRSMPEVLILPTGKLLVTGGKKEDFDSPDSTNEWCQLKRPDLYDPDTDSWRRLADMGDFREYHAVTFLLPDGRVLTTAGTNQPGLNPPPIANKHIEALSPPYLFRGVRPHIEDLSTTHFQHGGRYTMTVSRTNAVTSVVLIGMSAISHWMDGGVPRLLRLDFTQVESMVTANVPADPVVAPIGYYLLFAMVDDIPSEGRIVSIGPGRTYLLAAIRS